MRMVLPRRSVTRRRSATALFLCSRALSSECLNLAIITGTTRTDGPPRPVNGPRVASFVQKLLERRGNIVTVVDPRDIDLPLLEKPHFAYVAGQVPSLLQEINEIFRNADAYVVITPEYNHAPSPGLVNVLNHFGSSAFSFKPSAIVSYSAGQWGGTRAAHSLRPILSELGCIPVSAMIHIPFAQDVFNDTGDVVGDQEERWIAYSNRCFSQLEWWGQAAKEHRKKEDPSKSSPAFRSSPSQRSAP